MPTKLQTLIAIARFTVITLTVAALVSCGGGGSGGQPSDRDDDRLTQDATKPVITLIGPTQVTIAQGAVPSPAVTTKHTHSVAIGCEAIKTST